MMEETAILDIRAVSKHFGGITAVNDCSLTLAPGKIYALIGPNGSGKTTLFNCITGLEPRDRGEIRFKGERIDGLKPHQVARRGIGRTFQIIRVFPQLTALENLLVVTRTPFESAYRRALEMLRFVTLEGLKDEYAGNLSYGQQKLLEFARVLMTDPELILLDEPAAGVNRTLLKDLLETIRNLRTQGKTVLIVEHDMKVVMELSEHIFVLNYGEKLLEGPPSVIQNDARVIEAYFGH
jgi:ABC-type branched-subunit amino acid transport system ATPase component